MYDSIIRRRTRSLPLITCVSFAHFNPAMSSPRAGSPADKPRLTEQEKKANHIASEQKRRQAIREGFDRLASLVPGMEGQGRSEAVVLQATIEHLRAMVEERKELLSRAKATGLSVAEFELNNTEGMGDRTAGGAGV